MPATPRVSFVIATYQRGTVLLETLRQVMQCGLPQAAFEIIVVDNASPDGTADRIAGALPQIKLIRLPRNEGPVAKNHGIKVAQGEFVVFLDDDAYPLPGATAVMLRHFAANPQLGAAVFDVTLPDGRQECSAYPDVFIGAGTGFRRTALTRVGGLPAEFFMQAEEYDLSFRLLRAGYQIQRFTDMPLRHLKSPQARIGERTTQLDVRNNLYLLARYIPAPLCHELAADWLSRYWMMAQNRDRDLAADLPVDLPASTGKTGEMGETGQLPPPKKAGHRAAYLRGAAEGLARWSARRRDGRDLLSAQTIETIFKFDEMVVRLSEIHRKLGFSRVLLADFGKNMLAYYRALTRLGVSIVAIADDQLAAPAREYRNVPIVSWSAAQALPFDAILISNLSPVHARRRAQALRRDGAGAGAKKGREHPVIDLFEPLNDFQLRAAPPALVQVTS